MKKLCLIALVILYSIIGYSQEKYVIGIISDNPNKYWLVLDYLENSKYVKVGNSCNFVQAIEVTVIDKEFKNYEEFYKYLKFEFDDLRAYRKDSTIFESCKEK